jgi:hypothetical protein
VAEVVFARVPGRLKQAVVARARERGQTLTAVVVELLERSLRASADGEQFGARLAASAGELEQVRARLEQAECELRAAREREQLIARTYAAFAERAGHELASCPQCRAPLRGVDLLVSGRCPGCANALTSLLVPTRFGSLVVHEYSALLGAVGVLAGLAAATSADGAQRAGKAKRRG